MQLGGLNLKNTAELVSGRDRQIYGATKEFMEAMMLALISTGATLAGSPRIGTFFAGAGVTFADTVVRRVRALPESDFVAGQPIEENVRTVPEIVVFDRSTTSNRTA